MNKIIFLGTFWLLISGIFIQNVSADASNSSPGFIIIDGSGSMWGQVEGTAKIVTMKKALEKLLVNQLKDDAEVGLMAYGHNRENDCEDIEMLVPLQKLKRDVLLKAIKNLKPRGKTPLAESIKQAVESLDNRNDGQVTTVYLFSDGKESCNQDPCVIARELNERYPNAVVKISTVAFDISDEEGKQQLMCIAKETGGTFYIADEPSQLNKATETFAAIVNKSIGLQLKVEGGDLRGTELEWTILSLDTEIPKFVENYSGAVIQDIEPGKYEIFVRGVDADFFGSVRVEVKPDELTVATIPIKREEKEISIFGEGEIPAGSNIEFDWDFSGNNGDLIYIMLPDTPDRKIETDEQKVFRVGSNDRKQLPVPTSPRQYELRYYDSEKKIVIARKTFKVGPPGIKLTVPEKVKVGNNVKVEWTGPSSFEDRLFVAPRNWQKYNRPADLSLTVLAKEGESLTLPTPAQAGLWEVRYYSWGNQVSISSAEFEIVLPEVTLSGPEQMIWSSKSGHPS